MESPIKSGQTRDKLLTRLFNLVREGDIWSGGKCHQLHHLKDWVVGEGRSYKAVGMTEGKPGRTLLERTDRTGSWGGRGKQDYSPGCDLFEVFRGSFASA